MKILLAVAVLLSAAPLVLAEDEEPAAEEGGQAAPAERIESGGSALSGAGVSTGAKDTAAGGSTAASGGSGSGAPGSASGATPAGCKVVEVNWARQINFTSNSAARGILPMQSVKSEDVVAYKVTAKYIGKMALISTFVPQHPHDLAFSTKACDFKPAGKNCSKPASVFGELHLPVSFDGRGCNPPKADVYYVNFRWAKAERQGQTMETCPKGKTCNFALRFD